VDRAAPSLYIAPVALKATVHHVEIALSDVDRGVYEALDLRVAQHPSETMRYLLTRLLAYSLSYEEGIAFSKGGLSSMDEPPISIRDGDGTLRAWIDIGTPSAERLHKAAKAADRVALYTSAPIVNVRREASARAIHRVEEIEVWQIDPAFLDAVTASVERRARLDLTRSDGHLYVSVDGTTLETKLERTSLVEPAG
jgi:uncharacterized protein YaeQ